MGGKGEKRELIYRIQTDRSNIGFINALIESYEHVAIVRVVDKKNCIMEVYTSSDFKEETEAILESLKKDYGIRIKLLGIEERPLLPPLYPSQSA